MGICRKCTVVLMACLMLLAGCSRPVQAEDIAGKVYRYEGEGFGGPFTIRLEEDGTFTYYEGSLSSYIGNGEWSLEGETVTLQEAARHFLFRAEKDRLVFQAEGSGQFTYLTIADGEKFLAEE